MVSQLEYIIKINFLFFIYFFLEKSVVNTARTPLQYICFEIIE